MKREQIHYEMTLFAKLEAQFRTFRSAVISACSIILARFENEAT